jgi:hypothetical protein
MKKFAALLGAGALMAAAAGPAAAAPGNGNNCVGSAVSFSAHNTQQVLDVGFGALGHSLGITPASAIKLFEAQACDA